MIFEISSKNLQPLAKLINYNGIIIFNVQQSDNTLIFNAKSTTDTSICPDCRRRSKIVRGKYIRGLLNLSIYTFKTTIQLIVRKFKCLNCECKRKMFSEQFIGVTKRYARITNQLKDMLSLVFLEVSARKGSYLSKLMKVELSPSTCLRYVHQLEVPTQFDITDIGIDDWAYRKGRSYGSIVVDSKTMRTIDLIETRLTDDVSEYLKQYNDLKTVTRDRAPSYAAAINSSHSNAIQIADKFHLVKNLGDAVYEEIKSRYRDIMNEKLEESDECMQIYEKTLTETPLAQSNIEYHPIGNRSKISPTRQKLFEQIHKLIAMKMGLRTIARELGLDRNKVRRLARMKQLEGKQISCKNNYIAYTDNVISGCAQGMTRKEIYNMIVKNGFRGKQTAFYAWFKKAFPDYLKQNKTSKSSKDALKNLGRAIKKQTISSKKLSIYVTSPTFGVNKSTSECSEEHKFTHELIDKSIELTELKNFSDQFRYILKEGNENELDSWLESVLKSDFEKLHSFAKGIRKDIGAVNNAIKYNYTNGLVEGSVNRLKTKKREMYGRAGFELLRRKVCLSVMG